MFSISLRTSNLKSGFTVIELSKSVRRRAAENVKQFDFSSFFLAPYRKHNWINFVSCLTGNRLSSRRNFPMVFAVYSFSWHSTGIIIHSKCRCAKHQVVFYVSLIAFRVSLSDTFLFIYTFFYYLLRFFANFLLLLRFSMGSVLQLTPLVFATLLKTLSSLTFSEDCALLPGDALS